MASGLPDDLLEEIFLHLDDAADLARASAACVPFRRVVSDGRFLRRLSSLHRRRPVLGLLGTRPNGGIAFYPAEPPHSSAPAAAALAADYFSSSSSSPLPYPNSWRVLDVRDRRVLLSPCAANPCRTLEDLVVYDPLHRRHVKIPAIPGDLLEACRDEHHGGMQQTFFEPFLAPAVADNDNDDGLSFRVICNASSYAIVAAFVFSSVSRQWQHGASLTPSSNPPKYNWRYLLPSSWARHYANSCFYWTRYAYEVMLVLDTSEMKFSIVDLPAKSKWQFKVVVEAAAGEGRLGLLVGDYELNLYSKAWPGNDDGAVTEEWRHDNTIPMPEYRWVLAGAAEGYVVLRGLPRDHQEPWEESTKKPGADYFTVDCNTLKVEKLLSVSKSRTCPKFLYVSFPPPFSPPSI